jgi:hypothetical protein
MQVRFALAQCFFSPLAGSDVLDYRHVAMGMLIDGP